MNDLKAVEETYRTAMGLQAPVEYWRTKAAAHKKAEKRAVVQDQVEKLEFDNKRLNAKVGELEMSRRLDRDAYGQVETTLGDLQSQLARQSDDLAFYRSIVSPADGIQGLRIQRFEVLPGELPRQVRLKLTLVQAMRHESIVAGLAQITLIGTRNAAPVRYSVGDLLGKEYVARHFPPEAKRRMDELVKQFGADVAKSRKGTAVSVELPTKGRSAAGVSVAVTPSASVTVFRSCIRPAME